MAQKATKLITELESGQHDAVLKRVYIDDSCIAQQRERYTGALKSYIEIFGDQEVSIFSAPGRSEVCGNHTDHQLGKVLATSVNVDIIAVVALTNDLMVHMKSEGYDKLDVDLSDLAVNEQEFGTTKALIRGVAADMKARGYEIGGFNAYVTSQVLSGSGISSSAAFEVLIGTILSGSYNGGVVNSVEIAQIGQVAENKYFGKPSGLMDQMACSVGGLIFIDFKDPKNPLVEKVDVDFASFNHSLCIVDTRGSHADLTDDYAQITVEMKKVAAFYGADVLRQVKEEEFYRDLPQIRAEAGDRAILRAIHLFDENHRVEDACSALNAGDFEQFKKTVKASGESSYKFLQNVYSIRKPSEQGLALAQIMTEKILGTEGTWRVHGGGFAGTIQAFVPDHLVDHYKTEIEKVLGEGACYVMKVRPDGGLKVL